MEKEFKIENINIDLIKGYKYNQKEHPEEQIKDLMKSIEKFGFTTNIILDKDYILIAGHGRIEACKRLGIKEIPSLVLKGITASEANALRIGDNKLNESKWIEKMIEESLKYIEDEDKEFTFLDEEYFYKKNKEEIENEIPKTPETPKTKKGDLYELGNHRVLCGDSTKTENVDLLVGKETAKILFSSPPYNMASDLYSEYGDNLGDEDYINLNIDVVNNYQRKLKGFLFWNISYNINNRNTFLEILYRLSKETKMTFLDLIVWYKKTAMPVISENIMTRPYEDILVLGDEEIIKDEMELISVSKNSKNVYYNKSQKKFLRNYWEIITAGSQIENHKACYPVELPERAIKISSKENDIVLDPFLGSGTTLIACEKTNRRCYGMEMSEKYVDVIVERYVRYSGNKNIKLNGKEIEW